MSERGRPVVYKGRLARHIVALVRKHGTMGAQAVLAGEGTKISRPTMSKLAKCAGVELRLGRRAS